LRGLENCAFDEERGNDHSASPPLCHNTGMSWLIYAFGSGLVFFLGCIFVLLAQAGFLLANRGWRATGFG